MFIVDDSDALVQALSETLVDLEIARCVGSALSEDDALAWLSAPPEPWDVLVLEPRLQQGNGLTLLDHGRQGQQKLLVLTYYASEEMRSYCLARGADAVFDKSTQLVALLGHMEQLRSLQAVQR
ncbi:MAG: response regulator [Betaproteobacteria bacterium]